MAKKRLKILFHQNCFDGAASAAVFATFYRQQNPDAEIEYQGVQHKTGNPFSDNLFDADEHACLDFRYSQDSRLTWWFDHHVSAFGAPGDREHFENDSSGRKFYDPTARSNTKFEYGILKEKFGLSAAHLDDLVAWADVIDGAQFDDPSTPVRLEEPALKLMTWVENNRDARLTRKFIEDLQKFALGELAEKSYIKKLLKDVMSRHEKNIEAIRQHALLEKDVCFFDLVDMGITNHNKFIPYMLFPSCRYTVGLIAPGNRIKASVGYNPWCKKERTHEIAAICERYGGGGHPFVGGITWPVDKVAEARQALREIVDELKQG